MPGSLTEYLSYLAPTYYLAPTNYPARACDAAPARDLTHYHIAAPLRRLSHLAPTYYLAPQLLNVIQLLPDMLVEVVRVEEN